jgi:hypothetical protein
MSRTIGLLAAFASQVTLAEPPRSRYSASASRLCWDPEIRKQADALILIKNNVETLLKGGKIVPGTDTLFGQSIFAVGVRAGEAGHLNP